MTVLILFFKQKTAYEMRISDGSSDVCSSDLGDPALEELRRCTAGRRSAIWVSDGTNRRCEAREDSAPFADGTISRRYDPEQRLVVVGTDPFAMAIAGLGKTIGWQTILLSSFGPSTGPHWGISHDRRPLRESMRDLGLDRWTRTAERRVGQEWVS